MSIVENQCCRRYFNYSRVCILSFNFVAQMLHSYLREPLECAMNEEVWGSSKERENVLLRAFKQNEISTSYFLWTEPLIPCEKTKEQNMESCHS